MARTGRLASIAGLGILVLAQSGCAAQPVPMTTSEPIRDPTAAPSAATVSSGLATGAPSIDGTALGHLPVRGRIVRTAPIEFSLATSDALVAQDWQPAQIRLFDPTTFEQIRTVEFGSIAGAMPPDGQSVAVGSDGVWITLAAQRAVALVDLATGEVIRRLEVDGAPYNVVEHEGDLWIADFEGDHILRVEIASGTQLATIDVQDPTGIAVGEGSVWATVHVGRQDEGEPIEGNGGQIARIDPATNEVIALIDVGPRPYWVVVGLGSAWTGNATGGSVSRIDAVTNAVSTIPVPADGAFDIEVVGDHVWVGVGPQHWAPGCDPEAIAPSGGVVRIDPRTDELDGRVEVPCGASIVPEGDRFWVFGPEVEGVVGSLIDPRD